MHSVFGYAASARLENSLDQIFLHAKLIIVVCSCIVKLFSEIEVANVRYIIPGTVAVPCITVGIGDDLGNLVHVCGCDAISGRIIVHSSSICVADTIPKGERGGRIWVSDNCDVCYVAVTPIIIVFIQCVISTVWRIATLSIPAGHSKVSVEYDGEDAVGAIYKPLARNFRPNQRLQDVII